MFERESRLQISDLRRHFCIVQWGLAGRPFLVLRDSRDLYKHRNTYILSSVIMTLELVAQVDTLRHFESVSNPLRNTLAIPN